MAKKKTVKKKVKKPAKAGGEKKVSLREKCANYKKELKEVYDKAWLAGYNACKENYKFGQATAAAAGIKRGYKDKRKVNAAQKKAVRLSSAKVKA